MSKRPSNAMESEAHNSICNKYNRKKKKKKKSPYISPLNTSA